MNKLLNPIVVALTSFASVPTAQGQFLDMGPIVRNNFAFDQRFYPWAWQRCVQVVRQMPNNVPLPFNAGTISAANRDAMRAWMR